MTTNFKSTNINIFSPIERLPLGRLLGIIGVVFSLTGLANQWKLLSEFGISLSDYADIDDFLVATINLLSSYLWLFALYCIVIGLLLFVYHLVNGQKIDSKIDQKIDNDIKKNLGEDYDSSEVVTFLEKKILASYLIVWILCLSVFPYLGYQIAHATAKAIKDGNSCKVEIQLKLPGPTFAREIASDSDLYIISGINSSIFVYERPNGSDKFDEKEKNYVHAIPTSAIAQITYNSCSSPSLWEKLCYFL